MATYVVGAIVLIIVAISLKSTIKTAKSGGCGCGCECGGCSSGDCEDKNE